MKGEAILQNDNKPRNLSTEDAEINEPFLITSLECGKQTKIEDKDQEAVAKDSQKEDSPSKLHRESTKQESKEIAHEDQSKTFGGSDNPQQPHDFQEVVDVKTVADTPAGISNEKSKNASELKVKANATSSCQIL